MTVNDVCDCIKNDIAGLKSTMISGYVQDINEYNLSGRVLATCELDELKQVKILIKFIYLRSIVFH
jgi:hypothetical protein